jgi:hypothetical protein
MALGDFRWMARLLGDCDHLCAVGALRRLARPVTAWSLERIEPMPVIEVRTLCTQSFSKALALPTSRGHLFACGSLALDQSTAAPAPQNLHTAPDRSPRSAGWQVLQGAARFRGNAATKASAGTVKPAPPNRFTARTGTN